MEDIFSKRRTIRLFRQEEIGKQDIEFIVNAGRLSPSAMNLQPLKFIAVVSPDLREGLFPFLSWGGYVKPLRIPKEGQRPPAYIVVCSDDSISTSPYIPYDVGSCVNAMMLAATEKGIGSCWLGAIKKDEIKEFLGLPENLSLHCLVALGYPAESPVVDSATGDIKYFLDGEGVLHVPKRPLDEVLEFR